MATSPDLTAETRRGSVERYMAAVRAVRSGATVDLANGNRCMTMQTQRAMAVTNASDLLALVGLLHAKGLVSTDEFTAACADGLEAEVAATAQRQGIDLV